MAMLLKMDACIANIKSRLTSSDQIFDILNIKIDQVKEKYSYLEINQDKMINDVKDEIKVSNENKENKIMDDVFEKLDKKLMNSKKERKITL